MDSLDARESTRDCVVRVGCTGSASVKCSLSPGAEIPVTATLRLDWRAARRSGASGGGETLRRSAADPAHVALHVQAYRARGGHRRRRGVAALQHDPPRARRPGEDRAGSPRESGASGRDPREAGAQRSSAGADPQLPRQCCDRGSRRRRVQEPSRRRHRVRAVAAYRGAGAHGDRLGDAARHPAGLRVRHVPQQRARPYRGRALGELHRDPLLRGRDLRGDAVRGDAQVAARDRGGDARQPRQPGLAPRAPRLCGGPWLGGVPRAPGAGLDAGNSRRGPRTHRARLRAARAHHRAQVRAAPRDPAHHHAARHGHRDSHIERGVRRDRVCPARGGTAHLRCRQHPQLPGGDGGGAGHHRALRGQHHSERPHQRAGRPAGAR